MSLGAFVNGVARALDITGSIYRRDHPKADPVSADLVAMRSDWEAVGHDICAATDQYADCHVVGQRIGGRPKHERVTAAAE
jgi:hypothetical protein